ncbi:MAG: hypothetical protein HYY25_06670 [Candidatus Wallbacteria bacterium]|nr:hypothetical protein [Candidatus Wallbacteria bacterium]
MKTCLRPALLTVSLLAAVVAAPLSAQPGDDAFGGLNQAAGARRSAPAQALPPATGDLDALRKQRLQAAQVISTAVETADDASAVPTMRSALQSLLALIARLETDLGLREKGGNGQPFYSYPQGLEKAALLNQCYVTAGQAYENIYRRSAKGAQPDTAAAGETLKFYWQASATGYFQLQQGNWEKKVFPDIQRDPVINRLQTSGKSAASLLFSFTTLLTGSDFSEARSDALRARRGILLALKEQADNGYAELDKTPTGIAADFGQRMAARDPAKVNFLDKQASAEAISEAYFRMGQEYLSASRTAQKDDDLLMALKHFQIASAQIYWSRTKKFRLKEAQVQQLAKAILARMAGDAGLAAKLATETGLPVEQVQAALDRFAEELVKFIEVPNGSRETPAQALQKLNPGDLDALIVAAQRDDHVAFTRTVRKMGLLKKEDGTPTPPADQEQRITELLAKLKELLNRDTVPYGYWLAVTGTPERAREQYFAMIKARFKLDVQPLASTIAAENFIRGLKKQESVAGIGPEKAAGAQGDFLQLARLEREAMSALVRGDTAKAEAAFKKADALLEKLSSANADYFEKAEATRYKNSFSQLRSRMYLEWGDMLMEQARQADRGNAAYQAGLLNALKAYARASDEYPMRRVELSRAGYYKRQGGDTRLPSLVVDSMETAGKHKIHTNPHAVYASKKLNAALEEMMLGNDPEFLKVVEEITRELLAMRTQQKLNETPTTSVDLSEEFKNKISKIFGDKGVILYDPQLSEVSRELIDLLYSREIDDSQRRLKLRTVVTRVARGGTVSVVDEVAKSMEEAATNTLAASDAVDQRDRDVKTRLENVVKQWDGRLSKATPNAQALNEIFFNIATKFRNRAQMAESQADVLDKRPDVEGAKQKRAEANENYLNAIRFYFMASKKVFYGNEKTFAFQLPEWDVSLLLAYRAYRLVAHEAPSLLRVTGDWAGTLLKVPAGSKLVFIQEAIKNQGILVIQGAKALLQEGVKAPIQLAGKGIAAAGRGIFGHARSPTGKLLSLGGLAFFVWLNYAHNVTLEENRLIVLEDVTRAEEAESAFWDLVRSRALPKPVVAAKQ